MKIAQMHFPFISFLERNFLTVSIDSLALMGLTFVNPTRMVLADESYSKNDGGQLVSHG